MKLFKGKKKAKQQVRESCNDTLGIIARANTAKEIKEMLSYLGNDNSKVLFMDGNGHPLEIVAGRRAGMGYTEGIIIQLA